MARMTGARIAIPNGNAPSRFLAQAADGTHFWTAERGLSRRFGNADEAKRFARSQLSGAIAVVPVEVSA